jgi:hypothetical protein
MKISSNPVVLAMLDNRIFTVAGATDNFELSESLLSKPKTNKYKDW